MPTAAPKNFGKVSPLPGDPGKRRMLAGKTGILTGNKAKMQDKEPGNKEPGNRRRMTMTRGVTYFWSKTTGST